MIMGNDILVKLLLIFIYDQSFLTVKEHDMLRQKYSDRIGIQGNDSNILIDIPQLD